MNTQTTTGEDFNWSDILPWTIIFKTLRSACSITVIILALVGVVAVPVGWILSQALFLGPLEELRYDPGLADTVQINRSPYRGVFLATEEAKPVSAWPNSLLGGPLQVFRQMINPFVAIFSRSTTPREFLYFLAGSLWSILVWSFVGLGITRISLLKLTRNENAGLDDAFDYSIAKFPTCLLAVCMPLVLTALFCIPTFLIGLLLGFDGGALLAGALWFVVLGVAFLQGIVLLGLMVGWPLIVTSVAAEGQNSFDAVTRAYAYVFQRPLNFLMYSLIALLFGGLCWLVVHELTGSVVRLGFWSTSWGANMLAADRMDIITGDPLVMSALPDNSGSQVASLDVQPDLSDQELDDGNQVNGQSVSSSLGTAQQLIHFWVALGKTVAAAFVYGLFWCLASAVYLLLRKNVDEMEMDEIYVVDERRTYELPPLQSDKYGIPQVQPLTPEGIDDTPSQT